MKNKLKYLVTSFVLLSTPFISGCSNIDISEEDIKSLTSTELLNLIDIKEISRFYNTVSDFNLGSTNIGEGEESVKMEIKGTIGVPKKITNAPIVFIFAGNNNNLANSNSKETDTYQGLNYLVDALSKYGFLTVAINTDINLNEDKKEIIVEDKTLNLVFEKHLDYLSKAINGEDSNYPISLYKKGNINNIGFIGQSNTGRTIYNIANEQMLKGNKNIKGLLSITPSSGIAVSSFPDIPTSILSTEHSLDTNISFDMYSEIERNLNRESIANLTYLIGGDSDKFNDMIEEDTVAKSSRAFSSNLSSSTNEDTIVEKDKHEEFLSLFAIDFFDYIFNGENENTIYSVSNPTAQKLYKKNVLSKLYSKNKVDLFNSNLISNLSSDNAKVKNVVESTVPSMDSTPNFNEPTTNIKLDLVQADWKDKNSSLIIDTKNLPNFKEYSALSLEWALNHADILNKSDLEQISISLIDNQNKESKVMLLDELPLNKINPNSENKSGATEKLFRYTPIAETRIPLDMFKDVDLSNINKIKINFESNLSGSILIKDISLKK